VSMEDPNHDVEVVGGGSSAMCEHGKRKAPCRENRSKESGVVPFIVNMEGRTTNAKEGGSPLRTWISQETHCKRMWW
jgi:hypothetical protein